MKDHLAIVEPDSRGRFHLRRFLGTTPGAQYRVYADESRATLTLERVEEEQ